MADTDQQMTVNMLAGTALGDNAGIVRVVSANGGDGEVAEDILQQALEEATECFDQTTVEYDNETADAVADGTNGLAMVEGGTVVGGEEGVSYALVRPDDHDPQTANTMQSLLSLDTGQQFVQNSNANGDAETMYAQSLLAPQNVEKVDGEDLVVGSEDDKLQPSVPSMLGSSGNPIRIVQRGNQYTSLQHLSAEQLSQIMQVVQQQQLVRSAQEEGGSKVLFNPQTQSKIVYRVIYPGQLHRSDSKEDATPSARPPPLQIKVPTDSVLVPMPRRPYKKRKLDDDEKYEGPELSQAEKDARKKHRPRTRSGRVSRPPKHMVKDYKHIHPLDWDEDYDDSDGGYSDFKMSGGEDQDTEMGRDNSYIPYAAIGSNKKKPFACEVCEKSYIGQGGLARHFRLNPTHGKADELHSSMDLNGLDTGDSNDSMPSSVSSLNAPAMQYAQQLLAASSSAYTAPAAAASGAPTDEPLKQPDEQARDNVSDGTSSIPAACESVPKQQPLMPGVVLATEASRPFKPLLRAGRGRGRGRPPKYLQTHKLTHAQDTTPLRRKAKLKELVRQCDDEELMEIVLPRLAKVITTWEFLLMKIEKGWPPRAPVIDVLKEYETLHKQVKKMVHDQLKPVQNGSMLSTGSENEEGNKAPVNNSPSSQLQITDETIARSLDISVGTYHIEDPPKKNELPFRYKFLTLNSDNLVGNEKRIVQCVDPEDLLHPPGKKVRLLHTALTSVLAPASLTSENKVQSDAQDDVTGESNVPVSVPGESGDEGRIIMTPVQNPVMQGVSVLRIAEHHHHQQLQLQQQQQQQQQQQEETELPPQETLYEEGVDSTEPHMFEQISIGMKEQGQQSLLVPQDSLSHAAAAGLLDSQQDIYQSHHESQLVDIASSVMTTHAATHTPVITNASATAATIINGGDTPRRGVEALSSGTRVLLHGQRVMVQQQPSISINGIGEERELQTVLVESKGQDMLKPGRVSEEEERESDMYKGQLVMSADLVQQLGGGEQHPQMVLSNGALSGLESSTATEVSYVASTQQQQQQQQQQHDGQFSTIVLGSTSAEDAEMQQQQQQQQQQMEEEEQQLDEEDATTQVLIEGGQMFSVSEDQDEFAEQNQGLQSLDGLILIRNPDGSIQIHGNSDQPIPLETVQALLGAMDPNGDIDMEALQQTEG